MAAAVILTTTKPFRVRIDDSKCLSPRQRLLAYHAILKDAIVGVGIVSAAVIDADNIRQATLQAMAKAIADLAVAPELVLVDGCDIPPTTIPCQPIVDGDHLSEPIACASIIAKVTRDRLMGFYHRLFPAYQFDRHKGYGTSLHRGLLKRHGPSLLHRLTFAPVAAAQWPRAQPTS